LNSVKIILKYTSKCFKCGEWIVKKSPALWCKGKGIKCIECIVGFTEDNSRLIVIEPDEEFYLK